MPVSLLDRILPWRTTTPANLVAALTMRPRTRGSLIASAAVISPQEGVRLAKASRNREWQRASFGYARALPEVGFALRFLANNSNHVRLFAGDRRPGADEVEELNDEYGIADPATGARDDDVLPDDLVAAAQQALDLLTGASPSGGGAAILAPIVRQLETVGEYYLVGRYDPTADGGRGRETWGIHSISEVKFEDGKLPGSPDTLPNGEPYPKGYFRLVTGEGRQAEAVNLDPMTTTVARGLTADAEWSAEPDSPMRSLIGVCERLLLIERGDDAALRSRAAGNGLLLWPEELDSIPDDEDEEEDEFDRDFVTQLTTPLTLDGSAAQVVPMIKRGAYQYLDKVRHLTFGRPLDPLTSEREARLLTRLGIGLDVPPEVITGLADTNHWNAWQITSDLFRHHQEPITIAAVEGLSIGYLRARLTAANRWPDELIRRLVIWYDASDLVAPADMSGAANDAHDRHLITDAGYRALRGIGEEFAPPEAEERAGPDPALIAQLFEAAGAALRAGYKPDSVSAYLGIPVEHTGHLPVTVKDTVDGETPALPPATEPPPTEEPSDGDQAATVVDALIAAASTEQSRRLSRRLAQIERTLRERIAVAADAALARALERAGNRARAAAQATEEARQAVVGQPPEAVLASLGPALVAALGLQEQQLLTEAFTRLREQYTEWTLSAAEEAIDAASTLAGLDRTDPDVQRYIATMRDRFADNVDASWPTLEAGLNDLAAERLYDPNPAAPEVGELPTGSVPPGLVRSALAVAGGLAADGTGRPPLSGLTSGQLLAGFLRDAGSEVVEYEWAYGISARPFPPHAALDGVVFAGFDDDVLSTAGTGHSWVGGSFAPGDHRGCHCDYVPIYTDGTDTRTAMEQISRTAHVEQYPDRPLPTRQATNDPRVYRPERIVRPEQRRTPAAQAAQRPQIAPDAFTAPTEELARATWDQQGIVGSDGRTYSTVVREVELSSRNPGYAEVTFHVLDPDGVKIGRGLRLVRPVENGPQVYHESFVLDREYQGLGLASRINQRAEETYRAGGVTHIATSATSTPSSGYVGGYVWARRGFGWADLAGPRSAAQNLRRLIPGEPEGAVADAITRLEGDDLTRVPTPYEVSELVGHGAPDNRIGRAALLLTTWNGVRWLPARTVIAAAQPWSASLIQRQDTIYRASLDRRGDPLLVDEAVVDPQTLAAYLPADMLAKLGIRPR